MDSTHGKRENRFYREEEFEKNIYERGSIGGGDGRHHAVVLPITTSVSSSLSDNFLRWADGASDGSPSTSPAAGPPPPARRVVVVEKEEMFEKVVTPSDVGKLNRLVIPKQHAEKYFPLDVSRSDMGLLLSFEDSSGKPWRFRYSYWNSSQSYVMTKGWSRFVKEKQLDAGDTVSFGRGVGDTAGDRLFIECKRRADGQHFIPRSASSLGLPRFSACNHSTHSPATHNHPYVSFSRSAATPWAASRLFVPTTGRYMRSASTTAKQLPITEGTGGAPPPISADSTKRVRLFGVNLEQTREEADSRSESSH